ncbi:anaerobic ribonucleoside-triphosphate reductase activating protein [bacterium]|nr:MAG: anaerobic ribonucleoside-triphosphate reductase activating protein [bacterium]
MVKIGGFQKTSLIDYPKHLSAIIWTIDCNFRCPFCYNQELVFGGAPLVSEKEIINYLKKRQGILEALVITGGEPTLQKDLKGFIKKVKKLDYLVKIDTNGTNPNILKELLDEHLIDYVAMDIKAPKGKYSILAGAEVNLKNIEKSIKIIKKQAPDYEFRTTIVPDLLKKRDIIDIAKWLKGSRRYILQQFQKPSDLINKNFNKLKPYKKEFFKEILKEIKPYFDCCEIRGI